ncbi:HET-domain-containing protein [Melanomma pulvis-pyrius CBS 109.77]|uniref:HET-domain-containing protein n=1 Tax=Melanomma pulvis-pyrius CBS 109.77 TaxID=1314802 RepID=A0A6A6X358_9PLEO|nr:HET-domain-containing protein [Melanomma pulvis-pyrius CBS 109.77]
MRLLYYTTDRELRWTEDLICDDQFPPYAILSHTWQEGQEVTFDDLINNNGKGKAGFDKIQFCAQQAERDGLRYFWVDTCCINKSSSTELSEAINSMFRWYQNAQRCYVYLPDVSDDGCNGEGDASRRWKPAFKKSRWFTRGWTLQELVSPKQVEFFSREGQRLGDKQSLEQTLHEITGIPIEALRGSPLSNFSEDERFSWAATRQTTRKEDMAYCLLGIFDIQMPLLYGEGQQKAMRRLRKEIQGAKVDVSASLAVQSDRRRWDEEVDKIRCWLSAPDPSTNYQKALKQRQDDTGIWFLESDQYDRWKTDAASFLWLHGIPGCGKTILSSTILQSVLQYCKEDPNKVVAYFYFDFNDVQKQSPELMLHSLICQLLQQFVKIPASLNTLFSSSNNGQQQPSLHTLEEMLQQIIQELPHVYMVLDAMDECSKRAELVDILETLAAWQLQNLHILMTSRRERDIESSLETFMDRQTFICIQSELVDKDIQKYVQRRLSDDKRLNKWGKNFTLRQEIEAALMKGAHGMFRWAACQLDMLGECRSRATLRKALTTLPLAKLTRSTPFPFYSG